MLLKFVLFVLIRTSSYITSKYPQMHSLFIAESAKLAADNFLGLRPFSQKHFVGGGSSGESGVIVMVLKIEQS